MNVITREQLSPEQKKRNLYERQKQLLDTFLRNLTRNGELEEGTELFFVPQPTNPYDNNCILVNTSTGQTLGTLSKEMAATIAPQIKQGYSSSSSTSFFAEEKARHQKEITRLQNIEDNTVDFDRIYPDTPIRVIFNPSES